MYVYKGEIVNVIINQL